MKPTTIKKAIVEISTTETREKDALLAEMGEKMLSDCNTKINK